MRFSGRAALWVVGCALIGGVASAAEGRPVCLLTGFEPFGGARDNPSWEMLKPPAGQTVAGRRIETIELPVVYDEMAKPLADAIAKHRPQIAICFGQGFGRIRVERVARNGYHPAKPPDNKGNRPLRAQIVPGAPEKIATQLPHAAILKALLSGSGTSAVLRDQGPTSAAQAQSTWSPVSSPSGP